MKRARVGLLCCLGWLGSTACSSPRPAPADEKPPSAPAAAASPAPVRVAPAPAATAAAQPGPKRRYVVAALGDSLTDARVGGGGYLRVLEAACPKSRFLNFGKGGDMTNQMRRRFDEEIAPLARQGQLTTLLLYGGVNDLYSDLTAGRTNPRIEAELSGIYAEAKQLGLSVVAITVSPWGGFTRYFNARRSDNTRLLNSWLLSQVSAGAVDRVVDSYPILSCGDPERICPDYENRGRDGLHLGPQGHAILGQAVLERAFDDCE